jgi:hypothetical protein
VKQIKRELRVKFEGRGQEMKRKKIRRAEKRKIVLCLLHFRKKQFVCLYTVYLTTQLVARLYNFEW